MARIVAVAAAQGGISRPFIAAECLRQAGEALGHGMQVEARGAFGVHAPLSDDAIRAADAVVVAADAPVDQARFAGKRVLVVGTRAALSDPGSVIAGAVGEGGDGANDPQGRRICAGRARCSVLMVRTPPSP